MEAVIKHEEERIISNPKNYFGIMALTMTIGSCWGGIVAMYVLMTDAPAWVLLTNVLAAMMNNVAAIAQVEYKLMMRLFYASLIVNLFVLLGVLYL